LVISTRANVKHAIMTALAIAFLEIGFLTILPVGTALPATATTNTSSTTNLPNILEVCSQNQDGATITGYYAPLYSSGGQVLATGYTCHAFNTMAGTTYEAGVDNYGSCAFVHWTDGVTADPRTFTANGTGIEFQAVYNCGGSPGGGSPSSVTVNSVDQNGNAITGYWTALYDASGSAVATGFTPKTFSTIAGTSYNIEADSYGSCTFSKWSNGATSDPMSFTAAASAETFTAVYNCSGGSGGGGSGTATMRVDSVSNANNQPISGYYVVLFDSSGNIVATGFTPTQFTVTAGDTYSIQADNYGSCTFNHWLISDVPNNTSNPMTFTFSSTYDDITANYSCG
jgi:hypothetical protein